MADSHLKVVCGACGGGMRVVHSGEPVVCPHCSVHLRVPPETQNGARLEPDSGSGVLDRLPGRSSVLRESGSSALTPGSTGRGVSRLAFLLVASYASAVTLVVAWLLLTARAQRLESLPDVRPLGDGELLFVGYNTPLPEGHILQLGESRRFGDVRVTPLRVSAEPLEFRHYENPDATRDPTAPVLKLWLRLENLSDDTAFPPYDAALMSHLSHPVLFAQTHSWGQPRVAGRRRILC